MLSLQSSWIELCDRCSGTAAVVFDETGPHVFTIMGGKAHRVFVTPGADHGNEIEISGPVQAGAMVAVQGAYELQDGMSVRASR